MPVQVSVIVAADSERSPNGIIGTVDNQSMPTDQFELAVVDLGLDDEQRRRLDRLAAHRPNVRVLSADDDWPAQLAGAYVLEAGHDHRLFPDTLNLLLQHALFHGLDAVAGRVVQLGSLPGFLPARRGDRPWRLPRHGIEQPTTAPAARPGAAREQQVGVRG